MTTSLAREIQERQRIEQELTRSRELLDQVFELADTGLILSDDSGAIIRTNEAFARILGYPPQELLGRSISSLVAPEERPSAQTRLGEHQQPQLPTVQTREWTVITRTGERRVVRGASRAFVTGAGTRLLLGVAVDVTQQRSAERAIHDAYEQLNFVLSSITDGYIILDDQFRFVDVNPVARELIFCGRPLHQMLGQVVWDLYPQTRPSTFHSNIRKALAEQAPVHFEGQSAISKRWFEVHVYPRLGRLELYLRDITDRKKADQALRDSESRLREALADAEAANRAKDQFLAILSHELRTPLTPVLMSVAAMEMDRSLPPEVRQDLAMIRRNIELETKLIDDLLDVTRIVNGKLRLAVRPTDTHTLLRNVLDILRADYQQKQQTVSVDLAATDTQVCADPARLQQVFWNLIKNAIKFTPDRGRITVRTSNLGADASGRARLAVEICDDGLGIESESLSRLFNAFEQGDSAITRRFGGLGLGLTISKALIELHGGTICAHSDGRDQGSKFSVELPTTSAIDRILERIEPPAGLEAPTSVRVLLVEDHKDTQRVLKRLLEQLGYTVFTAGSVASAIEAVRANELDLLISDIGLPDGTGLDLVRDLPRPLPAIALSGFGMEEDLKSSRLAGFAVHLTKPIDMPLLDAAIRRALTAQTQVV